MPYPDERYPADPDFPRPQTTLTARSTDFMDKDWYEVACSYIEDMAGAGMPVGIHGDVIYHNGAAWTTLTPGTDGQFLKTQGAAANPTWDNIIGMPTVLDGQIFRGSAANVAESTYDITSHSDGSGAEVMVDHPLTTDGRIINAYIIDAGNAKPTGDIKEGSMLLSLRI